MSENRIIGLGIDAGGTKSRWALVDNANTLLAQGEVAGMSGLQMHTAEGRKALIATLATLQGAVCRTDHFPLHAICAGMTGVDQNVDELLALIAQPFSIPSSKVSVKSDIDIAYRDLFAPGSGFVVYAGTGSIAAFIDARGEMHRAGGRGVHLDDAGSGFWIAKEALKWIWREEDLHPGAWRQSAMARAVFAHIGGHDWAASRTFFYTRERGEIGKLALAVAMSAAEDAQALTILQSAGHELARLANALISRFGEKPVALTGRAATLHPAIFSAMREAVPNRVSLSLRQSEAHIAAARIAAGVAPAARVSNEGQNILET